MSANRSRQCKRCAWRAHQLQSAAIVVQDSSLLSLSGWEQSSKQRRSVKHKTQLVEWVAQCRGSKTPSTEGPTTKAREPNAEGARLHQRRGLARCGFQQPSAANAQESRTHPWFRNIQCSKHKQHTKSTDQLRAQPTTNVARTPNQKNIATTSTPNCTPQAFPQQNGAVSITQLPSVRHEYTERGIGHT